MWKDILLIVTAIIAVLTWFGFTPFRLRNLLWRYLMPNKLIILLLGAVTASAIVTPIIAPLLHDTPYSPGFTAGFLVLTLHAWRPVVEHYASSKPKVWRTYLWVLRIIPIPTVVLLCIEMEDPVWRKVAIVVGSCIGGILLGIAEGYARKWWSSHKAKSIKPRSS